MPKFCIAGLVVDIEAPTWAINNNMKQFLCADGQADIRCKVIFEKRPVLPRENGKPIYKDYIYTIGGDIHCQTGCDDDIPSYTIASSKWSSYAMYIDPQFDNQTDSDNVYRVSDGIFNNLRNAVIAMLAQRQGIVVHSCSIIWNGVGLLFSAPSGTGKSTHAALWKELYGVQVLDGDATACRITDDGINAYGLPWCGTSNEFMNLSVPLDAIIFLQQAPENNIEKLDRVEAFMRLTERCIMLRWSELLTKESLETIQLITEKIDCYLLKCLPDYNSVELVKECLEKKRLIQNGQQT